MNENPEKKDSHSDSPTPEDLAGIPVCVEKEENITRPRKASSTPLQLRDKYPLKPTAEDLAGIPVCIEDKKA